MLDHASILFVGLGIIALSVTPPLIHYFMLSLIDLQDNSEIHAQKNPKVTVVVPARDESSLICDKLEEILSMDYPESNLKILVIDSASKDDTRNKSEKYLSENSGNIDWEVVHVPMPGKSLAVNTALGMIDTDFFVMTDVDSRLESDSLSKIISGFQNDDNIGAICGSISISERTYMKNYRTRFNLLRLRESAADSTPIFEGSICAFRTSAISSSRIYSEINADDSQLALLCRRNGYRAVMQEGIEFTEPIFPNKQQRIRSLRRAQGIVRVLLKNKDLSFGRKKFNRIFLQNLYFYVFMPWVFLLGSSISFWALSSLIYFEGFPPFAAIAFVAIFLTSGLVRGFLSGVALLIHSQLLLFLGVRLDEWKPFREIL